MSGSYYWPIAVVVGRGAVSCRSVHRGRACRGERRRNGSPSAPGAPNRRLWPSDIRHRVLRHRSARDGTASTDSDRQTRTGPSRSVDGCGRLAAVGAGRSPTAVDPERLVRTRDDWSARSFTGARGITSPSTDLRSSSGDDEGSKEQVLFRTERPLEAMDRQHNERQRRFEECMQRADAAPPPRPSPEPGPAWPPATQVCAVDRCSVHPLAVVSVCE